MIKDGVGNIAAASVNTALDTVLVLTAAGQSTASAVESSRILTIESVRKLLEEQLGNKSASVNTHKLATSTVVTVATPACSAAKSRKPARTL
ncbi:hypothetical protein BVK86_20310 [Pseudomonas reinekei]|uniref:Uncharacterized protein n=1 Tax=Pseudomonas reinekei TaxID=395598 RepID=A0A1Q9WQ44_PSERE|nr:hypothetical protein BVK86_20310 [Pseudomonas reinekei]